MTTTINITDDNNETLSQGITKNNDGTFTAMTFTKSKDFKTYAGACRWMTKRTN